MARSAPEWRYFLTDTISQEEIGEIKGARSPNMSFSLLNGGPLQASLGIPTRSKISREVRTVRTSLVAKRNGVEKWYGLIATTDEELPGSTVNISAVGDYELLNHRVIRDVNAPQPINYVAIDRGQIALNLLAIANSQLPTLITPGFLQPSGSFDAKYEAWANIGAEITQLSNIENGFDLEMTYKRAMNIHAYRGSTRDDVLYGYGVFPRNLSKVQRREDGLAITNRLTARGRYDGRYAEDQLSQAIYGLFEELAQLGDVTNPAVLQAYAGAEVALRSTPRVTYTIIPKATRARGVQVFDDFDLGDTIAFSAVGGRLDVQRQGVRVFGFGIAPTDKVERITSLETEVGTGG